MHSSTRFSFHIWDTLRLAWPVILGQLGNIMVGMADTAMVGSLSPTHQAAAALANSLFFLVAVIGIGVMVALTPLVSQEQGRKDEAESARYLPQGIWMAVWLGLATMVASVGLYFLIDFLDQPPAVAEMAKPYLLILSLTSIPVMVFLALKQFVEGYGRTVPGMVAMYGVVGINVLMNYLFIFGSWGFPRWELNGAGVATILARLGGLVFLLAYVSWAKPFRRIWKNARWKPDGRIMRRIAGMGFPSGFQYFFEVGAFSGAVVLAGHIGEIEQAAHQVAISLASFTYMIYLGVSTAASIRVGNAVGAQDRAGVALASRASLWVGVGIILVSASALLAGKDFFPSFFTQNQTELQLAAELMVIAAFFQVFDGIQCITVGALRGLTDVQVPMVFIMVAYWVLGLPLAWGFAVWGEMGVEGLWYGLTAGLGFSASFLLLRLRVLLKRPLPVPPETGRIPTGH